MSTQSNALLWRKGAYQFGDHSASNQNQPANPADNPSNESKLDNDTVTRSKRKVCIVFCLKKMF